MTTPRRRIIRPQTTSVTSPDNQHRIHKLRARLQGDRQDFARWLSKLKRAFHVVEKTEQRITRLERQITKLEGA